MKNVFASADEMAQKLVGDGKKPNKFFVTLGYGYYTPHYLHNGVPGMQQVENSLKSVTIGPFTRNKAEAVFNAFSITVDSPIVGTDITNVMIEDRLTGVVKEKCLEQRKNLTSYRVDVRH